MLVEPHGRICRTHPEVEQHEAKLAEMAAKVRDDRKIEKALRSLHVISLVEYVRMAAYMQDVALELVLSAFAWRIPQSIRAEVERRVRELGPITPKEYGEAVNMAAYLASEGMA
jgi:hypothetical protein